MLANLSSGITNLATKPEWQGGGRSNAAKASYLQNQIFSMLEYIFITPPPPHFCLS